MEFISLVFVLLFVSSLIAIGLETYSYMSCGEGFIAPWILLGCQMLFILILPALYLLVGLEDGLVGATFNYFDSRELHYVLIGITAFAVICYFCSAWLSKPVHPLLDVLFGTGLLTGVGINVVLGIFSVTPIFWIFHIPIVMMYSNQMIRSYFLSLTTESFDLSCPVAAEIRQAANMLHADCFTRHPILIVLGQPIILVVSGMLAIEKTLLEKRNEPDPIR